MKLKKFVATLGLGVSLLGIGTGVAYASEWQILGYDYVNPDMGGYSTWSRDVYTSVDGGSMGVKIPDHAELAHYSGSEPVMVVQFYEDDGILGRDLVKEMYYYPWDHQPGDITALTYDMSLHKDGANDKAELIVKYLTNYDGTPFDVEVGD